MEPTTQIEPERDYKTYDKKPEPDTYYKKVYPVNADELYITLKENTMRGQEYYQIEKVGSNLKLTPKEAYPTPAHPETTGHRKVRRYQGRTPCLGVTGFAMNGQIFHIIRMDDGVIWLIRITKTIQYTDLHSLPLEAIEKLKDAMGVRSIL